MTTEIEDLLIKMIRGNSNQTLENGLELRFKAATKEVPENRLLIFKRGIDPSYEEVKKIKMNLEKILKAKTDKEPVVHGNIFGYILKWKTTYTQLPTENKNGQRNRKN